MVAKDHGGKRAAMDFPIPGEGDVDFASIFATLRAVNFAGPVIVERLDGANGAFSANSPIEVLDERVKAARINLERLLAEAGFEV
jgi:sugar phosphate isomerase/epimerase